MTGKLYVIATPIGNLEDITLRALRLLREVDLIAAEDTRVTRKLLTRYEIDKPVISCHEHSDTSRITELVERLERGEQIALVSDAGTPAFSDPGRQLVAATAAAGIETIAIPGPSALAAAISITGWDISPTSFFGFVPSRKNPRKKFLESIRNTPGALVMFESPRRIAALLTDGANILGERRAVLCRELTKMHEQILRGSLAEIAATLPDPVKGEITLVIEGFIKDEQPVPDDDAIETMLREQRQDGESDRDLVKRLATESGRPRREVYEIQLKVKGKK
jgi:16S rRNA (cytidine1402-2'-O)-methyltransferase